MLDLLIIGASAAGSSAAIYAARKKLNFKIIAKETGGEIATSGEVTNFPGWGKTDGETISKDFQNHLKMYDIKPELDLTAKKITLQPNNNLITKAKKSEGGVKEYKSKSIIIATGMEPRRLKAPGEKKLRGKGISYCTVCDGPLFQGKIVATIGGGNSALESAIMLKDIAKRVYLININDKFKGDSVLIEKVKKAKNIKILYNATTTKFIGDKFLKELEYKDKNSKKEKLDVQGAFVHIGMIPNSKFTPEKLEKNDYGEIIINKKCQTNIKGLFAAGDVTNLPYKQIAIASGHGTTAALSAINYLNKQK